jgi:hypothetical protein
MSFWQTSTTEQKLAQIDGGNECRMTSKQIAVCLGAPSGDAVRAFGLKHGRHFNGTSIAQKQSVEVYNHAIRRNNAERRGMGLSDSEAALIFPRHEEAHLFDFSGYEEN